MTSLVTLIPAYKKEYLEPLLEGLASQNYKDFRVILSDDSPGGEISRLLAQERYMPWTSRLQLDVVPGPCEGGTKNMQYLLEGWGHLGSFVHVHLDDDVIYPDFYRAHMAVHTSGTWGASVSLRWVTRSDGTPHLNLPLPDFLDSHNERVITLDADRLFASTVPSCQNWLGEMSNMVLSAEGARHCLDCSIAGIPYYGLSDIGTLLSVGRSQPVAVIRDHLSGFRSNAQQSTANTQSFGLKCGYIAWIALALGSWHEQMITAQQATQAILLTLARINAQYPGDESFKPLLKVLSESSSDLETLYAGFREYWLALLDTYPDSRQVVAMQSRLVAA
jgi:hypothetical protein